MDKWKSAIPKQELATKTIKILGFLSGHEMSPSAYYRCYLPLRECNRSALDIEAQVIGTAEVQKSTDADLSGRDIYLFSRVYADEGHQRVVGRAHDMGGVIVFDTDDDLTEDSKQLLGRGEVFKEMLAVVDYVTVSTPHLAKHLGQYTKRPPVVLRNQLDVDWFIATANSMKRFVPGLTVGFSGTWTHDEDWGTAIVALRRAIWDEELNFTPLIHGPWTWFTAPGVVRMEKVPYSVYPGFLSQFDILLCAVDSDSGFSASRSAIKAIEAMAVGAVPLCSSNLEAYRDLAAEGAPIVMVGSDGWLAGITELVLDGERRRELSARGPAWVREHRNMRAEGYKPWAEFYRSVASS